MTCREFNEFIMGYLDRELPTEVQEPFERHVSRCPACECYLSQYTAIVAAGKAAFCEPGAGVPDDVPEELIQAILAARRG